MITIILCVCVAVAVCSAAIALRCLRSVRELQTKLDKANDIYGQSLLSHERKICAMEECMEDLRNGLVPAYEKSKAAAKAMNDFNDGIAQIMGYDPMAAIKRERNKGGNK